MNNPLLVSVFRITEKSSSEQGFMFLILLKITIYLAGILRIIQYQACQLSTKLHLSTIKSTILQLHCEQNSKMPPNWLP